MANPTRAARAGVPPWHRAPPDFAFLSGCRKPSRPENSRNRPFDRPPTDPELLGDLRRRGSAGLELEDPEHLCLESDSVARAIARAPIPRHRGDRRLELGGGLRYRALERDPAGDQRGDRERRSPEIRNAFARAFSIFSLLFEGLGSSAAKKEPMAGGGAEGISRRRDLMGTN